MTSTDKTRTPLAVLGKPDRTFSYRMGPLDIPYLALSYKEMDLIDAIPAQMPEGLDDDEVQAFVTEKRRLECEAATHLLGKRLAQPPTFEEVYDTLNPDLFYDWVNALLRGDKGEAKGAADKAPPAG